jgi:hypothetical protein
MRDTRENRFYASLVHLVRFQNTKLDVSVPIDFDILAKREFTGEIYMQIGLLMEDSMAKCRIQLRLRTTGQVKREEARAWLDFEYLYHVENLKDLVRIEHYEENYADLDLQYALATISYSTTRGFLPGKLLGTVFETYLLPITDVSRFLHT